MAYSGTTPYLSRFDGNQTPTMMGVVGTLGTADTAGTALMLPPAVDALTGAIYTKSLGNVAAGGTNVNVVTGTINLGSVAVTNIPTIQGIETPTVARLGLVVPIAGTDSGGTIYTYRVDTSGNLFANVNTGTINAGTLVVSSGTLSAGTVNVTQIASATPQLGTGDALPGTTLEVMVGLSNGGTTMDRWRQIGGVADNNQIGVSAVGLYGFNSYSGNNVDRLRIANTTTNNIGTGLLGVGILGQDSGGTYHNIAVSTGGSAGTIILPNIPGGTINLGTTVDIGRSGTNFNSAGTTTITSTAGILHTVTINTPVASDVITLYNSAGTSAAVIAKITLPAALLNEGPNTAIYDISFGSLTLAKTSTSDVTVAYR